MSRRCLLLYSSICFSLFIISCKRLLVIEKMQELKEYASGSGLGYWNKQIYIVGDDMSYLLISDTSFKKTDTIQLGNSARGRISKDIKQDLESVSILRIQKAPTLLLLGSGSAEPYRTGGWLINMQTREKKMLNLKTFYDRLQAVGIKERNIEGVTGIPGGLILANRGNKSFPKNYLVFTSQGFWDYQETADIRIMKLGVNTDTTFFRGVSGLDYSSTSDCLLLTVSTENTYSNKADGTIGKSYLWLIKNISSKKRMTAITPDQIFDLEKLDKRFKGHKIESVCVLFESKSEYHLILVADDDKGTTILFKVVLRKES